MTLVRVTELYCAKPTYRTVVELYPIALESSFTPVDFKFPSGGLVMKAFIATEESRGFASIEGKKSLLQLAGFDVRFLMPTE